MDTATHDIVVKHVDGRLVRSGLVGDNISEHSKLTMMNTNPFYST